MKISLSLFYHIFQQLQMTAGWKLIKSGLRKGYLFYCLLTPIHSAFILWSTLISGFTLLAGINCHFFPKSSSCDTCDHSMTGGLTLPLFSPVLGLIPELCQCRDLELDCDGAQLQDIPAVAVNVTMMWVENKPLVFQYPKAQAGPRKLSSSTLTVPACEECWSRCPFQNTSRHCEYLLLPRDEWKTYLQPVLKVNLRRNGHKTFTLNTQSLLDNLVLCFCL